SLSGQLFISSEGREACVAICWRRLTASMNNAIIEPLRVNSGGVKSFESSATQSKAIIYGSPSPVSTDWRTGRKYTFFMLTTPQQIAEEIRPATNDTQHSMILIGLAKAKHPDCGGA